MTILNKIQQELKAPKGQRNNYGGFNYRSCEDILEAVKPLLGEATLVINDEIVMIGDRYYVKATATLTEKRYEGSFSIDNSSPVISATAYAREPESKTKMDEAQITGASSSYARKYALNGLFCIDDTKDADTKDNSELQTLTDNARQGKPSDLQTYLKVTEGNKDASTQINDAKKAFNREQYANDKNIQNNK
jgi:hypothetical protein